MTNLWEDWDPMGDGQDWMVHEIIVVEGKADVEAVKRAVDCECIITQGYGFDQDLLEELAKIEERRGIIVLTDPDYAGNRIRTMISDYIPSAKQAFLPEHLALKGDDIGIENASPESIRQALENARVSYSKRRKEFTLADFMDHGLEGVSGAKDRRLALAEKLHLSYANAKQMLARLNEFGIEREEFEEAMEEIHRSRGELDDGPS